MSHVSLSHLLLQIQGISELSVDELSSLVTNSVTKAFGELDELYVELEELRQKCPFPECIDLDKLIADQKQCILCVVPDGRIWCIWILLCNTPDVLGGVNATGGGSYLPGYKRKYTTCDSIVALRNINSSLILTGGVQPMDITALNPIEAHNSRTTCTITPEQLQAWRDAEQRWTCPYTRQLEARIQAKLILVQMKHCQRLGVLTALLDAGGITKLSHRVIEEILKLAPDLAGIVISKLGHIQGFKDGRWNAEEKVDGISKVFAEAYDSLGIVHDETLEEIFFRDYGFSPRKRGWDVGSKHTEASRALMSKPKAKMKGNKNAAGARTEETKAKMKGNKNAAGARTEAAKTLISKSQEGLSYVRKDGTHVNKWKVKEHKRFIKGLKKFGWSDWVGVASVVGTRSNDQCKNHAGRMRREEKKRLMLLYKKK